MTSVAAGSVTSILIFFLAACPWNVRWIVRAASWNSWEYPPPGTPGMGGGSLNMLLLPARYGWIQYVVHTTMTDKVQSSNHFAYTLVMGSMARTCLVACTSRTYAFWRDKRDIVDSHRVPVSTLCCFDFTHSQHNQCAHHERDVMDQLIQTDQLEIPQWVK